MLGLARVGSPEVDVYFDTGAPHVCSVERAKALGAQLIVLGAAGGSLRPSNTAQRVLRASPLPVLIARGTSTGPILAATDLSDPSISAIKLAVRQAEALGRELHVVHVVDLERETGWLNSVKRLSTKGTEACLARAHEAMDKAQTDLTMLLAKHAPHAKGHIDHGRTASAMGDVSLRHLLQNSSDRFELKEMIACALKLKPKGHRLHQNVYGNMHSLSAIGG